MSTEDRLKRASNALAAAVLALNEAHSYKRKRGKAPIEAYAEVKGIVARGLAVVQSITDAPQPPPQTDGGE